MTVAVQNTTILNTVTDYQKKSYAGYITRLMPNGQAPLFGMTSMIENAQALQFEHGYYSKSMLFPSLTNGVSSAASTITTLTIVANTNLMPGMLFQNDLTYEV